MGKRKKGKRKWAVLAAVICIAAVSAPFALKKVSGSSKNDSGVTSSIVSAEAARGTISNTISGSGTLALADARDIVVPTGITIEKVLAESGDTVKKGQVLATVSQTSVASAISQIQDSISQIDEELEEISEDTQTKTVTAPVSGRVKDLAVSAGDDAGSVVKEQGSLLAISTDGKMAVDLETEEEPAAGDTVSVTLPDGTSLEGSVDTAAGTAVTVTISDDGPDTGEKVTVKSADGKKLGSGTLYVHQPLLLMDTSGTVSKVYVSENESIDQGDDLYKLTGVIDQAARNELVQKRADLADALNLMLGLQESGQILSDADGIIVDVNVEADEEVTKGNAGSSGTDSSSQTPVSSSDASESTDSASSTAAETASVTSRTLLTLSSAEPDPETESAETEQEEKTAKTEETEEEKSTPETEKTVQEEKSAPETEKTSQEEKSSSETDESVREETEQVSPDQKNDNADSKGSAEDAAGTEKTEDSSDKVSSETASYGNKTLALPLQAPAAGNSPMTAEKLEQALKDADISCRVKELTWKTGDSSLKSSDLFENGKSYQVRVVLTMDAEEALVYMDSDGKVLASAASADTVKAEYKETDGQMLLTVSYTLASSGQKDSQTEQTLGQNSTSAGSSAGAGQTGTGQTGTGKTGTAQTQGAAASSGASAGAARSGSAGSTGNAGSASSGTGSAASSGTGSAAASSSESGQSGSASADLYSMYETVGFTVTDADTMQVEISVTEMDILSVEQGQSVSLQLDALDGETFEGTVEEIASSGSSSGGSTKYAVTVSIPRDKRMLEGMSATAVITVSSSENVVTIPADALQERHGKTFVYTTEEDGELGGETEIETGLSNGTMVEVTSGLSEGDTVCYRKLSGSDISSDDEEQQNMMGEPGGFGGPNGSSSGGGMPSGGPGGDSSGGRPSGGSGRQN